MPEKIASRVYNTISEGVTRLQDANQKRLQVYHQSIVELDHVLLSDITTKSENREILTRAAKSGLLGLSQRLYQPYETLLEESFVRLIKGDPNIDLLGDSNITQNYLMRYYNLATHEIRLARIISDDHVLFIGSGPLPITAIEYARQTGCQVDCVEILPEKAEISRDVIRHLGMQEEVRVHTAPGQEFPVRPYSAILVGVLAQPKQEIFDNLEKNCRDKARIIARTTTGLRQFIYPAAQFQTTRFTYQNINQARHDQALSAILLA